MLRLFSVPVITTLLISCSGLPVLAAGVAPTVVVQEEQEQQEVSQDEIEKYEEVKGAAKKERIYTATQSDSTVEVGFRWFF